MITTEENVMKYGKTIVVISALMLASIGVAEDAFNPKDWSLKFYDGLEAGEFVAKFYDSDGNTVAADPTWNISCDFIDDLVISYVEDTILISVDNPKLVNKSFELSLSGNGYEPVTISVTIKAFL